MSESKKEIIISYIRFYSPFIICVCIILLLAIAYTFGVYNSCDSGYILNNKCVEPKVVDIIQVCEYNGISCAKNCENAMIKDKVAFYEQYGDFGDGRIVKRLNASWKQ